MKFHLALTALLGLMISSLSAQEPKVEWKPIFNGKDLDGWHALPGGKWEVSEGSIRGTSPGTEKRHGLLVTDKSYSDFVVRAKFRVHAGNSGFYFRIEEKKNAVGCAGFQAEVDRTPATGGLYETSGRAWVTKPDPELMKDLYQPGEWTEIEVSAIGKDITVRINGKITSQLENDPGRTEGKIALQLHGGQDMDVEFKELEIREVTPQTK